MNDLLYLTCMVLLTAPLMSLSASGTFKNTLTFVCGTLARIAERKEKKTISSGQSANQTKWSEGCQVWQSPENDKSLWEAFGGYVKKSGACDVSLSYYFTGFQLFMAYYMTLGPNNWINYPNPPLLIS